MMLPMLRRIALGMPALACAGMLAAPASGGDCTPAWLPGSGVPGISGVVHAATMWDSDGPGGADPVLVVGGTFTVADNTLVNNVAYWNGSSWSALGSGLGDGPSDTVNALTVYNGSLVAGGAFTASGATTLGRIARWNGSAWVRFNSGSTIDLTATVNALTVYNGSLVAGGTFTTAGTNTTGTVTVNRLARWNGAAWGAINPTGSVKGVNGVVNALAVAGGDLVAGGSFATAGTATTGSLTVNNIARWSWNGADWVVQAAFDTGTDGAVRGLAVDAVTGDIVIGGDFTSPGSHVARWNGSAWSGLGDGIGSGEIFGSSVNAVAVLPNGDVVAGGPFYSTGPAATYVSQLARYDGSSWSAMWSESTVRYVTCLYVKADGTLIVGGSFKDADGVPANGVAAFDGTDWSAFTANTTATSGPVTALLTLPNGDVIASGGFRTINGVTAGRVARYSSGAWSAVGSGLATAPEPFYLSIGQQQLTPAAVAVTSTGDLIVGGMDLALTPGGDNIQLTKFDGSSWSDLGLHTGNYFGLLPGLGIVSSVAVMPNGDIVAGGIFFFGGDTFTSHFLARWDGTEWVDMGITSGAVLAMKVLGNGHLVIGGAFTDAGGALDTIGIAEWDGTSLNGDNTPMWSSLGSGTDGSVYALTVRNGNLIASGAFTSAGGNPATNIAEWNGSSWSGLGSGADSSVYALAVMPNNDLVAGGAFSNAGGNPANRIARWNGSAWSALGGGLGSVGFINNINFPGGSVFALAVAGDGTLLVGGDFGTADGDVSAYIARYGCEAVVCAADFNGVNGVTVQDIFDFLTAWLAGSPSADFNHVNGVTVQDIFDFLTAWLAGC